MGQLVRAGQLATFDIGLTNTSTSTDSFTVNIPSAPAWNPVTLYSQPGGAQLTDTNGSRHYVTSSVSPGAVYTLRVAVQVPAGLAVGASSAVKLSIAPTSSLASAQVVALQMAVPAGFATGYLALSSGANHLLYAEPGNTRDVLSAVPGQVTGGFNSAVAQTPAGNIVYAWQGKNPSSGLDEVRYAIFSKGGAEVRGVTQLVPGSNQFNDRIPTVAAAPDGKIAIGWVREVGPDSAYTSNAMLRILNADGSNSSADIQVTNNLTTGNVTLHPHKIFEVEASVSGDNHVALTWTQASYDFTNQIPNVSCNGCTYTRDIWLGVYSTQGSPIGTGIRKISNDTSNTTDGDRTPGLAALSGGRFLLTYSMIALDGRESLVGRALDSSGNLLAAFDIVSPGTSGTSNHADSVQLSNGRILVAWGWGSMSSAVLNGSSFQPISGVTQLTSTDPAQPNYLPPGAYASVAADASGRGIITWMDEYINDATPRRTLYYALVDSNGAVITPPMPIAYDAVGIRAGEFGHNTTGHDMHSLFAPMIMR